MKLLLNRKQKNAPMFSLIPFRIGAGNTFMLSAEMELDEEERSLLEKYKMRGVALTLSDPTEDLKNSFRTAIIPSAIVFIFLFFVTFNIFTAIGLGLAALIGLTIVYFNTMREQIVVRDLLNGGRTFRCDSVVDLIHKEAFLKHITSCFRQVLESAKNWEDREQVDIPALDPETAKRLILKHL